jgi:hypothetical protein
LNVPRFVASGMVRQLRTEVTDTLCRLLPGADGPVATGSERWVRHAGLISARLAPELVRAWEPSIPQENLGSAAIHGMWLLPISFELAARRARSTAAEEAAPRPTPDLLTFRHEVDDLVRAGLGTYYRPDQITDLRARKVSMLRSLLDPAPPREIEWGAWTMLAALRAMGLHDKTLPRPGRDADRKIGSAGERSRNAGEAFALGNAITLDTALSLLAET